MENASKALIMAGGVLIGILILTIGVVLFTSYGNLAKEYEQILSEREIQSINSNFVKFEARNDITIDEIVTLCKFVKEYEHKNEMELSDIYIDGNDIDLESTNEEAFVAIIKSYSNYSDGNTDPDYPYSDGNIIKFKCEEIKYWENSDGTNIGLVKEIKFKKLP